MPKNATAGRPSIKSVTNPCPNEKKIRAELERGLLLKRLRDEGEHELASKLAPCGQPVLMSCVTCKHMTKFAAQCKRKWCPSCQRRLAARRSAELDYIVARMRWPLFVTLTMSNVSDLSLGAVRKLRRSFGKLRHRKLWTRRTRGGIATIEITNVGKGWHPHLHAVIDCRWLAVKSEPPPYSASKEEKKARFKLAAQELERVWAKILGQQTASVFVKRANKATIAKEVVKYAVKGQDLLDCEGTIGDMLRALDSTRLLTTFGEAHGQKISTIRAEAKLAGEKEWLEFKEQAPSRCDCGLENWMPWKDDNFASAWEKKEAHRLLQAAA